MKTIGEIKEEFSAAREADWNAICQMYETDLRSGVQKLVQQYRKKLDALEKEKLRMEQMMQFEHKYEHLLQGLSLRNVGLTVFEDKKKIYTDFGELLFTHFGVSGPLVLSASAHMRHFDKKTYRLEIDLKPALDEQALDKRLLRDFEKYANHDFCNALDDLLPQKLIGAVVERTEIPPHEKVHDVTREQRRRLGQVLKHFSVDIAGPCPVTDAIVTSGGVKIGEIDPKTMASKLVKGLYFAGEIMDVDAYTGGFNLQIAWATGRAAGMAAAEQAPSGQEEEDT